MVFHLSQGEKLLQCNYPAPLFVNSQTDKANKLW
jgi:hypothetical protein